MMITWRWQAVSATLLGLMMLESVAAQTYGPGVTNSEIKIGQTMPYSGPLLGSRRHRYNRTCLFSYD